ncbi:gag-pol polyprotein [Tanacetum coccineum]
MLKYTIKSTDKAALKEYDQKIALYQTMNENKSFNINPTNHELYHALIEALIEDENAMDKGVADTGKKTKMRRTKESESSMKPSTTKETFIGKASSKSFKTGKSATAQEPIEEPIAKVDKAPKQDWFKQPPRTPTPDLEWNKRQVVLDQPEQPWLNKTVYVVKDPLTFNDLMATPINFSKYVMNRLRIDNLTQAHLVGPIYELMKGTCTSSIALKYNMEEFFKALIEDLIGRIQEEIVQRFGISKIIKSGEELHYVYHEDKSSSIISVVSVKVERLHGYGHLDEIVVKRADRQLYKFKEGDFVDLHLNDIEYMLLLDVQHKLFHLNGSDIVDLIVALRLEVSSIRRIQGLDTSYWGFLGNVHGRQNRGQGNSAWGAGAAGYEGAQNRVRNANPGQARQIKCYSCNGIGHIARNCTQSKRPQNSKYFKDKILLMQAQENRVALDEEQLLFIAGGQDNAVDEDVDEQPVQDLALNVDNVFQADDCDAFDFDVDEAPTAQTMFMANLSSADHVYDKVGSSYDSDILSKDRLHRMTLATNILLQGLPKDIYTLINHYTDAKDIWDNVKMLLEGSELTKEDRESQLYDDFEHFRQNIGETIHDYYVWCAKLINACGTSR